MNIKVWTGQNWHLSIEVLHKLSQTREIVAFTKFIH